MAGTISDQITDLKQTVTGFFTGKSQELETTKAALAEANDKLGKSDALVVELKGQITAKDEEIKTLKAELETERQAKADAETKATQAEEAARQTEARVDARSNQKALAIEQGRGVTAPVTAEAKTQDAPNADATAGQGQSKAEEYRQLLQKDPTAAAQFWAKHRDEIFG